MRVFRCRAGVAKILNFVVLVLGLGALISVPSANATPINYGDFSGTTVMYLDVTESSATDPTPLYGAPYVTGNSLNFDPVSFNFFSTGGSVVDITDGTLSLGIKALSGESIPIVQIFEAGDYTLTGLVNNAFAGVAANYFINIFEVDGASINVISVPASMIFTPSDGDYLLSVDGEGTGIPWTGSLSIDVNQLLIDENVAFSTGATRITIVGDNTLTTISQEGTSAFIAKKDTGGVVITVPEPSTFVLLLLGVGAFTLIRGTQSTRSQ